MKDNLIMDDAEIRVSGIEVLNKALGPVYTLRFLSLLQHEPTDYVQISKRIYEGQTIDQIWERSQAEWPKE